MEKTEICCLVTLGGLNLGQKGSLMLCGSSIKGGQNLGAYKTTFQLIFLLLLLTYVHSVSYVVHAMCILIYSNVFLFKLMFLCVILV